MKRIMVCCVVSLVAMFACVQPHDADEATERASIEEDLDRDARGEDALFCCTDWICPTTEAEYSGCSGGVPNQIQARAQCNVACNVACVLGGTYCY